MDHMISQADHMILRADLHDPQILIRSRSLPRIREVVRDFNKPHSFGSIGSV